MKYHFVPFSRNVKTGPIPVTYSERDTCPPSCPHYRSDCYAEDFHTRMSWDKVPVRGGDLGDLCRSIAALGDGQMWRFNIAGDLPGVGESVDVDALKAIVTANVGRRGFTYTHKKSENAIDAALMATNAGFTVNLSADDAGEADALAETGLPVCAIVPRDCSELAYTPAGRTIVVCPAQTRDNITCKTCGLCARADRNVIIGFRAHGTRAAVTDAKARRVIPIAKAA